MTTHGRRINLCTHRLLVWHEDHAAPFLVLCFLHSSTKRAAPYVRAVEGMFNRLRPGPCRRRWQQNVSFLGRSVRTLFACQPRQPATTKVFTLGDRTQRDFHTDKTLAANMRIDLQIHMSKFIAPCERTTNCA